MSRIRKILVPVDFSEHSEQALEMAVSVAKAFGGAVLHLLHCYSIQPVGVSPYGIVLPETFDRDTDDLLSAQDDIAELITQRIFHEIWTSSIVPGTMLWHWHAATETGNKAALQLAKEAHQKDPNDPGNLVWTAILLRQRLKEGWDARSPQTLAEIESVLDQCVRDLVFRNRHSLTAPTSPGKSRRTELPAHFSHP